MSKESTLSFGVINKCLPYFRPAYIMYIEMSYRDNVAAVLVT